MENKVKRKVCVITGGGSGMGLATAHRMAKKGYYTILCGRTVSKLENAVNELREAGGEPSLSAIYTSPISGMMEETYRFWVFLYFRGDMFM